MNPPQIRKPSARGRGIANPSQMLRRPGEFNGHQVTIKFPTEANCFDVLSAKLTSLDLHNGDEDKLSSVVSHINMIPKTSANISLICDMTYKFSLKKRSSALTGAMMCFLLKDLEADGIKFKSTMLRLIQHDYQERKVIYQRQRSKFLMNAVFLCEMFYHLRLPNGAVYDVLADPAIEYLDMLLDGSSEDELEIFADQFGKCFSELKLHRMEGLSDLILKMRLKLITSDMPKSTRALLLRTFEQALADPGTLDERVESLYQSYVKPVKHVCK